ncbi:DUF3971 domain-containing protein [Microvirga sp. ACRRW]|uniref:DUF3971 domain-containing protein n=1 Tax=Microvirga sp. ACRRW TaxID=2918205 RepID=UPI001EF6A7D3|nr:DUF3971 domain-containing protein [Microvirga sp. ACRRW]MCG7394208.1 DUF3971 domain-containing protein [Microvirga sp. ACRRW]
MSRIIRGTLYVKLGLIVFLVVVAGLFYLRLSAGPMSFGRLPERVAEALASRIGPGWNVALRNTAIELHEGTPALRANGLDIRGPSGELVIRAPYALVSVDLLSLLSANLQPKAIEVRDLQMRVLVNRDGSLTFSPVPATDDGQAGPAPAPEPAPSKEAAASLAVSADGPSQVSGAVGSLFELIVGPRSVLNSLGKAQLTNAKLVFIDADHRERARFDRLDATFDWNEGGRHFSAVVEGPQGPWQLSGDVKAVDRGAYRAAVVADDAPIQDIMLLGGMSDLPAATDLEFTGRFDVAFADGRVTELKTRLDSNAGYIQIEDKDTSPLPVEHATIVADWNEAEKTLNLPTLELKGGDTRVKLQGTLAAPDAHEPWRLLLSGKDIVWAGAAPGDAPLQVSQMEADLSGPDGVAINRVRLIGPDLNAEIKGALAASADPKGLKFDVTASKSNVRSALRVWPEGVAPPVRRFLVANLKSGTLEDFKLKVAMTGADVEKSISGGPIPDGSVKIDFLISQGTLQAAEGLPPVSRMDVTGRVTGTKVSLRAPAGRVDMGDYTLNASEGTFTLDNYWDDAALARIDFRLNGGADGVGAMLQQPLVKQIAGFDVDPAAMKGKADLRVGIGLAVNDIPAFADLPLKVTGALNELTVDKVFGKEKLENANLTIAYDRGDLSIKGDGKIGSGPATIDVQKTRQGGQANVSFILDEAARSKRGLSFGSQLTGSVALKAGMPLGRPDAPGIVVEADLAKAGVDQLIPGWVKPVGRPGKLTFTMVEGAETEIRDLQLDSGVVQLRGTALLSKDGELTKADLSTFKLSAGDDMRAQIEQAGGAYKVTVRGNVGDARPFIKSINSQSPARNGSSQKDTKDFDLDLNLNILTGYNNEAITNAVIKASVRKEILRQLEMKGRLGATNVAARTDSQGRNGSIIIIQSEDAGALLRFTDVYKRMAGGDLIINLATGDGAQPGMLLLRSFTLVNEPALRRIIPTQTQVIAGQDSAGNPQMTRVDVNEISFTRARMEFTRTSGRLDFKDAAIYGNQIGFTLGGFIDYARDRMDISGTFVPAYGLNNAFAKVPLFGPLLGGGQYEGLFAVNFRTSGQMSAPTLTVNPLSAVAPGFLRKLFGVGMEPQTDAIPEVPDR